MAQLNSDDIAEQLRARLLHATEDSIAIEEVDLREVEDPDGTTSWRVTLYLTAPESTQEGWPVEVTQKLKRKARLALDDVALANDAFLSGPTAVDVSMKDAPVDQVAPDDIPETFDSPESASPEGNKA